MNYCSTFLRNVMSVGHSPLRTWLLLALCMHCTLPSASGCYLRNCPLGKREGKRADDDAPVVVNVCPSCGFNGAGQCFGPFTCCTSDGGCVMGVGIPETSTCTRETASPIPCTVDGKKCGYNMEGVCGARGLCCTEERCEFTTECGFRPNRHEFVKAIRNY